MELKEFMDRMLTFFPSTKEDYEKILARYDCAMDTVIIEDVFMPKVIELLGKEKDILLMKNLFEFFENVSCYGDENLVNAFSVTVLEILGNDKKILETARKYMGPKTAQLQFEADRDLGRVPDIMPPKVKLKEETSRANKLKKVMIVVIGATVGVYLGSVLYDCLDYRRNPGVYLICSAPWYTGIIIYSIFAGIVLLVELLVYLYLCYRAKKEPER